MPGGRIKLWELLTYSNCNKVEYVVQCNAWMDTLNMSRWIDVILVPHLQLKAPNTKVVLIVDILKSHKLAKTINKLSKVRVHFHVIPGTSLVQPLDVGCNKPFKDCLKAKW